MPLKQLLDTLNNIHPFSLAAEWDNAGLIIGDTNQVHDSLSTTHSPAVLICIDLTQQVTQEALKLHKQSPLTAVIAYHPPIFSPIKSLTTQSREGRTLLPLIQSNIAVISPHTALDATQNGLNDWLLSAIAPPNNRTPNSTKPIQPSNSPVSYKLITYVPQEHADTLANEIAKAGAGIIGNYTNCTFQAQGVGTFKGNHNSNPTIGEPGNLQRVKETRIEAQCSQQQLNAAIQALKQAHPYEEPAYDIIQRTQHHTQAPSTGIGRICELKQPITLEKAAAETAKHLNIQPHILRTAQPPSQDQTTQTYSRVAVCPGAGASVFDTPAVQSQGTILLTGEMRHHDVLQALDQRCAIILAGHINTERPYLPTYANTIKQAIPSLTAHISNTDCWPFENPA